MRQTVPTQHPAVVLRSRHIHLQLLLAVAMVAIIGLSVAVGILAANHRPSAPSAASGSVPSEPANAPRFIHPPGQRYDGGSARSLDGAADKAPTTPPEKKGRNGPPLAPARLTPAAAPVSTSRRGLPEREAALAALGDARESAAGAAAASPA